MPAGQRQRGETSQAGIYFDYSGNTPAAVGRVGAQFISYALNGYLAERASQGLAHRVWN